MIDNPRYRTRHLGESLVRKYESYNVRGMWHENTEQFSFLFTDRTYFTFSFSRDGFLIIISPEPEYTGRLADFVERYVKNDGTYEGEIPRITSKGQFPKYKERLKLEEAKVNSESCTLVYKITDKMPDAHDSINETIEDYVLRRAFLFASFKRR